MQLQKQALGTFLPLPFFALLREVIGTTFLTFKKWLRVSFLLLLTFLVSTIATAQSTEYPPQDATFVVGLTAGAPNAGGSILIIPESVNWHVRLYRGKVKQSLVNDGSGIYYSKNYASDTIQIHGDTWHAGELVQLEFYRASGSIIPPTNPTAVTEVAYFTTTYPTVTVSPGSYLTSNEGGAAYCTKKVTSDGYCQFKYQVGSQDYTLYSSILDDNGHDWNVALEPAANGGAGRLAFRYDHAEYGFSNDASIIGHFFRFYRNGTTITVKSSATENGVYATIYTYSQSFNASSGIQLAGGSGGGNGVINAKISGAALIPAN